MREIKFRAWDSQLDRMLYGDNVRMHYKNNILMALFERNGIGNHETEFTPLMQYTGIKDKKGQEVYEGDIVRKESPTYWVSSIGPDGPEDEEPDEEDVRLWRGGTAQVIACEFGYHMSEIDCGEWCFNGPEGREWSNFEIEVIGNIYANPELL